MESLQETAIAIRLRYIINYCELVKRKIAGGLTTVLYGNYAPHNGNVVMDSVLVVCGYITDPGIIPELYEINQLDAPAYSESAMMVEMINKRATIQLNPDRYSQGWSKTKQKEFERVLRYFNYASTADWKRFEEKKVGRLPAMKAWWKITSM
ncbi:hypothetical protein B9Z19DRAFT_1069562 [Tuber borchii]|uniref:Uncharacterized protein n=1 Tax=Tuber borchii TaxID=42251 RepID=A0A2T6ZB50_TUBBO|nr:hypothetical protein B9Z19DRAFT_1069562 [Tuber borchii]